MALLVAEVGVQVAFELAFESFMVKHIKTAEDNTKDE